MNRPIRDCQCPRANHKHGTDIAYRSDGCRCAPCTEAHIVAGTHRRKQIAYGRYNSGYTNAEPARKHVAYLKANGVSNKRLAALTGINITTIRTLTNGNRSRGTKPPTRILERNANKILAIQPTFNNVHPLRTIDATGTQRRIKALVSIGHTQADLSRRLGAKRKTAVEALLKQRTVTKAKHEQVKALYDELWDQVPAAITRAERSNKTRAIKTARARGWLPPMAWDEDRMDDPKHLGYAKQVAA